MEFRSWSDWMWWHVAGGHLTVDEAAERLALELFIQRAFGLSSPRALMP